MTRLGIAATLGLLVILAGCTGLHRRVGHHPITQDWETHDPGLHSPNDPFTPQPQPGSNLGMIRYFPGLNRLKAIPEPADGPVPVAEAGADRPRLGFRLFRKWIKPSLDPADATEPTDPDQLARRGRSKEGPPAIAGGNPPPRLPVAMLAEVDPAILTAAGPAIAGLPEGRNALHQRDAAARRVQARPDDVASAPAPRPVGSDSGPVANPFEGFDLSTPPPSLAELAGRAQAESLPNVATMPAPVAEATMPAPVADEPAAPATTPTDPFAGFDPPAAPDTPDLFAEAESATAPTEAAPSRTAVHRKRYGHLTLPISRRFNPPPLESEHETVAIDESAGRPQLPLVRPWRGQEPEPGTSTPPPRGPSGPEGDPRQGLAQERGPGTSPMLPPLTFPPSYYGEEPPIRPVAARFENEEPRPRRQRFHLPRLFQRWRGQAGMPADPADLTGVEPDHVPQSR